MRASGGLRGRPLPPGEAARKLVHAAMGLFSLALPYLAWWQAAFCAVAAFCNNWLLLPRVVGHRMSSKRAGASDRGVLLYPVVVGAMILTFWRDMTAAAVGWGFLAFGDAAAGVSGMKWGRRALPWNDGKTWAGTLGGICGAMLGGSLAYLAFALRGPHEGGGIAAVGAALSGAFVANVAVAAVVYALIEGAPLAVDDNLVAPMLGALAFFTIHSRTVAGDLELSGADANGAVVIPLAVNGLCALLAAWKRVLSLPGIVGALVLGVTTWSLGGFRLWLVLLVFLAVGTVLTRVGWSRKTALGIAEGHGGRRGLGNVAAKGTVVLASSVLAGLTASSLWTVVAITALAAALADTAGSEIGKAYGGDAYLLPWLRRVPAGTDGAVSIAGTTASAFAAILLAALAMALELVAWRGAVLCAGIGFLAALVEGRFPREAGHDAVNLTLTLVAAAAAGATYVLLGW